MRYAIVINMDYDSFNADDCKNVWNKIRSTMVEAGFVVDKRLFTIDLPGLQACERARQVIEGLSQGKHTEGADLYTYMKDFYGYDHSYSVNLLLPNAGSIVVELR